MPRGLAYLPPGGGPVETCTRTIQGYALLRPGPEEDEFTLGVLGRALDYYRVELYAFAFVSDHYHLGGGRREDSVKRLGSRLHELWRRLSPPAADTLSIEELADRLGPGEVCP